MTFCKATFVSGFSAPALASLSTVNNSSRSRGSMLKKEVPMAFFLLCCFAFALGKARNCESSTVFSPTRCQTGCTPSLIQVSRRAVSFSFQASSHSSASICLWIKRVASWKAVEYGVSSMTACGEGSQLVCDCPAPRPPRRIRPRGRFMFERRGVGVSSSSSAAGGSSSCAA